MKSSNSRRSPQIQCRAFSERHVELQRLLPLWPHEINDQSSGGRARVLRALHAALRAERQRGRRGHWTYDLGRHCRLAVAYKAELGTREPGSWPGGHAENVTGFAAIFPCGCQAPSASRVPNGPRRNSAPPSGSRSEDPTFRGIPRARDCNACANDVSGI
jgi:hypothetical protein